MNKFLCKCGNSFSDDSRADFMFAECPECNEMAKRPTGSFWIKKKSGKLDNRKRFNNPDGEVASALKSITRSVAVLFLILFAGSVSAQIYPVDPSRDSLITYCLYATNTTTSYTDNLTQAKAIYLLNKSLGRVCTDLPALEKLDTVVLTKTSMGVSLNTDFIRAVRIYKIDHNTVDTTQILVPLRYIPTDSTWVIYPTDESNKDDPTVPSGSYFTHGQRFFSYPKSAAIATQPDSFLVFYNAMDAKLTTATDSVSIHPDYLGALIDLTTYEYAKVRRQDARANEAMARYTARLNPPKPREADLKR